MRSSDLEKKIYTYTISTAVISILLELYFLISQANVHYSFQSSLHSQTYNIPENQITLEDPPSSKLILIPINTPYKFLRILLVNLFFVIFVFISQKFCSDQIEGEREEQEPEKDEDKEKEERKERHFESSVSLWRFNIADPKREEWKKNAQLFSFLGILTLFGFFTKYEYAESDYSRGALDIIICYCGSKIVTELTQDIEDIIPRKFQQFGCFILTLMLLEFDLPFILYLSIFGIVLLIVAILKFSLSANEEPRSHSRVHGQDSVPHHTPSLRLGNISEDEKEEEKYGSTKGGLDMNEMNEKNEELENVILSTIDCAFFICTQKMDLLYFNKMGKEFLKKVDMNFMKMCNTIIKDKNEQLTLSNEIQNAFLLKAENKSQPITESFSFPKANPEKINKIKKKMQKNAEVFNSIIIEKNLKMNVKLWTIDDEYVMIQMQEVGKESENEIMAEKLKEILSCQLAHELKTLLNGIIGNLELLECQIAQKEIIFLKLAYMSSLLLLHKLNDLLDFSSIQNQSFQLHITEIDLRNLLKDVKSIMEPFAKQKQLKFVAKPKFNQKTMIGDSERIKQILINLLEKTIEYTKHGTIEFSIKEDTENNSFKFTIKSLGGIKENLLKGLTASPVNKINKGSQDILLSRATFEEDSKIEESKEKGGTKDIVSQWLEKTKKEQEGALSVNENYYGLGFKISQLICQAMNSEIQIIQKELTKEAKFSFEIKEGSITSPFLEPQEEIMAESDRFFFTNEIFGSMHSFRTHFDLTPKSSNRTIQMPKKQLSQHEMEKIRNTTKKIKQYMRIQNHGLNTPFLTPSNRLFKRGSGKDVTNRSFKESPSLFYTNRSNLTLTLSSRASIVKDLSIECDNLEVATEHSCVQRVNCRKMSVTLLYNEKNISARSERTKIYNETEEKIEALIVDDNSICREVIKNILKIKFGISSTEAENGKECIDYLSHSLKGHEFHIKIIFMDMQMPEMNGIECTCEIQRLFPSLRNIPIVGVSSNPSEEDIHTFLKTGICQFLPKPITIKKLQPIYSKYIYTN